MSRQRQKIERALNARGWKSSEMEFEPIGPMMEMEGYLGGWEVVAIPIDESLARSKIAYGYRQGEDRAFGYSADEVVEFIEKHFADLTAVDD